MPFGLYKAPATFQRTMDRIMKRISGKYDFAYLDDMIIFSKNHDEHIKHLEETLERLKTARFCLNKNKCKCFQTEIEILGNIVSEGKVKLDVKKSQGIREFRRPKTIRELRSFLGLINCRTHSTT